MNAPAVDPAMMTLAYVVFTWTLIWKGIAMWHAAKHGQKNWFIAFIVLNYPLFPTFGLLEIAYLFYFAKKRMTLNELRKGFKEFFSAKKKEK